MNWIWCFVESFIIYFETDKIAVGFSVRRQNLLKFMLNGKLFLDFVSLITYELELLYSFHLCMKRSLRIAFTACVHIFVLNLHKYLKVYWHRLGNILNSNFVLFSVQSFSEIFREESSEFFWVMQQPRYSPAPQNAMRPQTRPPVPNVSKLLI